MALRRFARARDVVAAVGAGLATTALLSLFAVVAHGAEALFGNAGTMIFTWLAGCGAASETWASVETVDSLACAEEPTSALAQALALTTGLLILAVSAGPMLLPPPPAVASRLALGSLLMVVGFALRAGAIRQLGPRFSSANYIAPAAALERSGLYRAFAHPSELGLMLAVAGGLCLVGQPIFWPLAMVLYVITAARVVIEERSLFGRHGDDYRLYRAKTFDPLPSVTAHFGGDIR